MAEILPHHLREYKIDFKLIFLFKIQKNLEKFLKFRKKSEKIPEIRKFFSFKI